MRIQSITCSDYHGLSALSPVNTNRTFLPAAAMLVSLLIAWTPVLAASGADVRKAAFSGDLTRLKRALDSGVDVDSADGKGSTPLMLAASRGHSIIVQELLGRGARINAENNHGWSPLMLAAATGHAQIVRLLLASGANPDQKNARGQTALDIARTDSVRTLLATKVAKEPPERDIPPPRPEQRETPKADPLKLEIDSLLANAERSLNTSRLTDAVNSFQKVLELVPGNTQARIGLERVASRYEQLAYQSRGEGDLEQSLSHIHRGLKIKPGHTGLQALQLDVQAALDEHERQRAGLLEQTGQENEIERLVERADRQLRAFKLTSPKGDNAYDSYRKIQALDPGNRQAQAGLKRIALGYKQLAQQSQRKGDLQLSLRHIERGLEVLPGHGGLLALRNQIHTEIAKAGERRREEDAQRQREAGTDRQRQLEQLLAQAAHQTAADKLTEPHNDNAYDTYHEVLSLDPYNAQAKTGLKKITSRFEQLASERQKQGALEEALTLAERGLKVSPRDIGLSSVQSGIRKQIAERERQLAKKTRRQEIVHLLEQANKRLEAAKLTAPLGDNAYESYNKVLTLDPNNTQAKTGLQQIASRFVQLARQHQGEGRLDESLVAIEHGLEVAPGHTALKRLRSEVKIQLEEQTRRQAEDMSRRQQVERLFARAKRQLEAGQLSEPKNDNAFASYQKVLVLDPKNAQAKAGLRQIATRFAELARQQQSKGKLNQSLTVIEQGLEVAPGHAALQRLRSEVEAQLDKQAQEMHKRRQIEKLFAQASRQLKAAQFTEPEDDNAYASYRKILRLAPENSQAKTGLQEITMRLEQLARQRRDQGALKESLALVGQALRSSPGHAALQGLRSEVKAQLEEQARRQAEEIRRRQRVEKLLAQAKRQLEASQLTEPENDNALASLKEALKLDPDNAEAKKELQRVYSSAEQILREKAHELRKLEHKLNAEEQALELSIEDILANPRSPGGDTAQAD